MKNFDLFSPSFNLRWLNTPITCEDESSLVFPLFFHSLFSFSQLIIIFSFLFFSLIIGPLFFIWLVLFQPIIEFLYLIINSHNNIIDLFVVLVIDSFYMMIHYLNNIINFILFCIVIYLMEGCFSPISENQFLLLKSLLCEFVCWW